MRHLNHFISPLITLFISVWVVVLVPQAALAGPTLTVSPEVAQAGHTVGVTGDGYGRCVEPDSGDTWVRLLWDGEQLTDHVERRGQGSFSLDVTVPTSAGAGKHGVAAECYNPSTGAATSDVLASTVVQVVTGGTDNNTGTYDCTSECTPTSPPTLQLSDSETSPGRTVGVTGDGYGGCTEPDSGDTSVRLLWDGEQLTDHVEPGGQGHFSLVVTVPASARSGEHAVAAECYDPSTGAATSDVLASSQLNLVAPTTPGSPSTPGSSSTPGSAGSPGPVSSPGSASSSDSSSSPGSASGSDSFDGNGSGGRVALVEGVGGTLALATLLVFGLLSTRTRQRRRRVKWVHQHVRAVARSLGSPTLNIESPPGEQSTSVRLEPHPDPGHQNLEEMDQ
jgi:uncharacterized membrane protein YgcG